MNNKSRRFFFRAGGTYHIYLDTQYSGFAQPHSHPFYQILLVNSGHISQSQRGVKYHQLPDDIFFTPPECEHSLFVFGDRISYSCLSFTNEIALPLLEQYPLLQADFSNFPSMLHAHAQTTGLMRGAFAALLLGEERRSGKAGEPGEYLAAAAISAAFAQASQYLAMEAENAGGAVLDAEMRHAVAFIDEHYFEDISVEQLARQTMFSKSCFCRKFQAATGMPPKRYITEKRLHEALKLIHHGDMPLTQIAEEIGYKDFSTFYRSFLKMTGVSASEYRSSLGSAHGDDNYMRYQF